jgi:hypothetical protein
MRWRAGQVAIGLLLGCLPVVGQAADPVTFDFAQTCNASAAVLLGDDSVLVADERTDVLHTYATTGGAPTGEIDLYPITKTPQFAKRNYSAFEGAARQGDMVFLITSHARSEKGANRARRRHLVALKSNPAEDGGERLEPYGAAYSKLHEAVEKSPKLKSIGLGSSVMSLYRDMPHLAPDKRGFNVEGLAARPEGGVLIGLRSPRPRGKAVLLPVANPDRLVLGVAEPDFGDPILLDLGGAGVASIAWSPTEKVYYIVAGHGDQRGGNVLYRWSGAPDAAPEHVQRIEPVDFDAQALAISADGRRLLLLSDDGDLWFPVKDRSECTRRLDSERRCQCFALEDAGRKRFRGQWIDLASGSAGDTKKESP